MVGVIITLAIIWGLIWGFATQAIINNKGYDENWFGWGFFFGFIAALVAMSKPDNNAVRNTNSNFSNSDYHNRLRNYSYSGEIKRSVAAKSGQWKCSCGKIHPNYVGTCGCGKTQAEVLENIKKAKADLQEKAKVEKELTNQNLESVNLDNLKKLKELLDNGVISQSEFDAKKKQLLGL